MIETKRYGDVDVVSINGDFDLRVAEDLRLEFDRLRRARRYKLVFESSALRGFRDWGLWLLVEARTNCRKRFRRGDLVLADPSPSLEKLIRIAGLDIKQYPDVSTAVASFRPTEHEHISTKQR